MKIAVVGGGLFGCTAAIELARVGHSVELFEAGPALLAGASLANQYRLHEGYHYPRSPETGAQCRLGNASFIAEYPEAIIQGARQYYAIARTGSKITADQYETFLKAEGLPYQCVSTPLIDPRSVEAVFLVDERRIDIDVLGCLILERLAHYGVRTHLNCPAWPGMRRNYEHIVVACYSGNNTVMEVLGLPKMTMQYEVCEKPVLRLPNAFQHSGVVVMDGPFCSVDPYAMSDFHVLGHVVHAIHSDHVGIGPKVPAALADHLNRGIMEFPQISNAGRMIDAASQFLPGMKHASHIGSMFSVRAVLPNKDATDERPTLVDEMDHQVIRIFSGKLGTAVEAARQTSALLARRRAA